MADRVKQTKNQTKSASAIDEFDLGLFLFIARKNISWFIFFVGASLIIS
jgi:hypothetical protein